MRWLSGPLDTVATFWRLQRRDGVTLGLTGHDRDVTFDGIVHRAAPGMLPSAIELDDSLDADTMDVSGALSHAMISDADLRAGRWDGAAVLVGLTDWQAPEAGHIVLARGELGSVEYDASGFRAELLSAKAVLTAPVAPRTSPTCRADFGGPGCTISLHRFTHEAVVQDIQGDGMVFAGIDAASAGEFIFGRLRWTDGANAGLSRGITGTDGAALLPDEPLDAEAQPGDRALLYEGCDKRLATCSQRFGNVVNYRGEPYLPGNDLLTRYPGG